LRCDPRGKFTVTAEADGYSTTRNVDAFGSDSPVTTDFTLTANRIAGSVRDSENNQPLADLQIVAAGKTFTTDAWNV
jgi:hypothetical protein